MLATPRHEQACCAALRKFSILFTMMGQWLFLDIQPTKFVLLSVLFMIGTCERIATLCSARPLIGPLCCVSGGSCVASMHDLAFTLPGYLVLTLNNLCTAAWRVLLKKHLHAR